MMGRIGNIFPYLSIYLVVSSVNCAPVPQDLKQFQIDFNKVYEKLYLEIGKLAEPYSMNCVDFKSFIRYSSSLPDAVEGALSVIEKSITELQLLSGKKCAEKSKIVPSSEFHSNLDTFSHEYRDKVSYLENLIKDVPDMGHNFYTKIENLNKGFNDFQSQIHECFPKP
ncbi:hypothetical protein QAD02_011169 [Eretmocerus hayati]|uniref:Uncharacterized protein n=1 Tax=Eretmocerus hayati TaxID=131215 RepID=A0ACC2NW03_9HYME|nr:hypothetical protein QAD02_011169 [Eretmocerus hayati]